MNPIQEYQLRETRRYFFGKAAAGIGGAALASVMKPQSLFAEPAVNESAGILPALHHAPTAKRVIWLFMADGPSQMDLFDYKPKMQEYFDKDLPESVRNGQRITTMTSGQTRFPIAPTVFKFRPYGENGTLISELLPEIGSIVDDITIVKSMNTDAINHDPAITFIQTGSELPGRPSAGA